MQYVVHVEQNGLRASSDPMEGVTALKVAKAWQSHGDRGVRIVEVGPGASVRSWTLREFIVFVRGPAPTRARILDGVRNEARG